MSSTLSPFNTERLKERYVNGEITLDELETRLEFALQPDLALRLGLLTLVAGNVINVLQKVKDE